MSANPAMCGGTSNLNTLKYDLTACERGVEHCLIAKSLYPAFCYIASISHSMLGSNASTVFGNDHQRLFHSAPTAHNGLQQSGPLTSLHDLGHVNILWGLRHEGVTGVFT